MSQSWLQGFTLFYLYYTSLQVIVMANIIQWNGVAYNKQPYPGWAELLGWMMALASILLIPGFAIHQMWKTPGTLSEVRAPVSDLCFLTSSFWLHPLLYSFISLIDSSVISCFHEVDVGWVTYALSQSFRFKFRNLFFNSVFSIFLSKYILSEFFL